MKPQEREALLRQIDAAVRSGNLGAAVELAERGLASGIEHPGLLNLAAHACVERGQFERAVDLLCRARKLAPRDVHVLNTLGIALKRMGRLNDAVEAFEAATAIDPRYANAHFNKGGVFESLERLDDARAAYEAAVALDPGFADATGRLSFLAAMHGDYDAAAVLAERTASDRRGQTVATLQLAEFAIQRGDHAAARALAGRVLAVEPGDAPAILVAAKAEIAAGEAAAAKARLETLLGTASTGDTRALALSLIGKIEEQARNFPQAFAAFAESKAEIKRNHASRFVKADGTTAAAGHVADAIAYFEGASADLWRADPLRAAPDAVREHVFLVGFPRSGTTLLEKALAAHPDVSTIEEVETLEEVAREFYGRPGGFSRFAEISAPTLARYREGYWRAALAATPALEGKVFIDKMPLNTTLLPFIARMFPRAKVLFALRDPRDVVLSCLKQQFALTPAMYEFCTLEGAARFYVSVMRLGEICRAKLGLAILDTRYEDLIADFDGATGQVTAFLGVPWNPAMRDVAASSKSRAVTTPSAPQLARGLYDGSGQWRNYRAEMAPVLSILAPWVERFGYPPD
jgi:Flp pilus assembly protein TadD